MRYRDFLIEINSDATVTSHFYEKTRHGMLEISENLDKEIEIFKDANRVWTKKQVATFGEDLRKVLFTGKIADHYEEAMKHQTPESGLRILLKIHPDYAAIPWEVMSKDGTPMSIDKKTPIVRIVQGSNRWVNLGKQPLQILVIDSNVVGLPYVDSADEIKTIKDLVNSADPIIVDVENIATKKNIEEKIKKKNYNIIYFIGHGDFDEGKGYLALRKARGGLDKADEEDINHIFLNEESIGLMVFNACDTAKVSERFTGLVPKLIQRVPVIVSMRDRISNIAAKAFARGFYLNLLGKGIEETLQETRQSMFNDADCDPRDYSLPILFLGVDDKNRTFRTLFIKTMVQPRTDLIHPTASTGRDTALEIFVKFYDIIESLYKLKDSVDYCVQRKTDITELREVSRFFKTTSGQFKNDYENLTGRIQGHFPLTYKEMLHYYNGLNDSIEELDICFSTIEEGITTINQTMTKVRDEFKELYKIMVKNIMKESLERELKEVLND